MNPFVKKKEKKMSTADKYYECSIINISDDVIGIDSSSESVINISDDIIVIDSSSESVINISDSSSNVSIITISDKGNDECGSIITINSDSEKSTSPSFDFESSVKMLLPQPRTSTPVLQRSAIDAGTMKAKKRKSLLLNSFNWIYMCMSMSYVCFLQKKSDI